MLFRSSLTCSYYFSFEIFARSYHPVDGFYSKISIHQGKYHDRILPSYILMRRPLTIFLLFTYAFSATEAHHFIKIPVIFQHYAEHKNQNNSIGFFEFLKLHYLNANPNDADKERDRQLPFKSINECAISIVTITVPHFMFNFSPPKFILNISKYFPKDDDFISSSFLRSVFQPPRRKDYSGLVIA